MSTVRKFTFDLDFDAPEEPEVEEAEEVQEEPEEEIPTFSEEELEQARAEGFEAGKEEGRRVAADATEQKLLEAIEAACGQLAEIYNTQTEANYDIGREMVSVSTAISKKMFPDLNARNALGEVERVVQETLKAVTEEPRIQIMVNPELRELLTERLTTMTHRAGFEGKVFVNPDPAMPLGDCRIEWSNGAAVRDGEELWGMIDEIIEHNLHGEPESELEDETSEIIDQTPIAPENEEAEQTTQPDPEPAPNSEAEAEPEVISEPELEVQSEPEIEASPDSMSDTNNNAQAGEIAPESADFEPATADETPTWQDAVGESTDAETASAPEPATEASDANVPDEAEIGPDVAHDSADAPAFMPSVDAADDAAAEENISQEQSLNAYEGDAPVPHLDDGDGATGIDEAAGDDDTAPRPPVTDPDPVSPATQAAILDAQSSMEDDDDRDPSG